MPGFGVDFGELCLPLVQVIIGFMFFLFYNFYFTFGLGREAFDNALYVIYLCLRDITDDEACVDELRMMFRFFGAVIVRRAQKVSVPYYCK